MEDKPRLETVSTSQCPTRSSGSPIPISIYDEILAWLHPKFDPDTTLQSHQAILARLAPVCRYFACYAGRESWRHLDFIGMVEDSWPTTQTWSWFTCTNQRLQLAKRERNCVKECVIQGWQSLVGRSPELVQITSCFILRFPRFLSTLDNLKTITLSETPLPYSLLQTIGRLRALEQVVISQCSVGDIKGEYPAESMFGSHETPFPALRQLTIDNSQFRGMEPVFQDVFYVLVGATTLRSLAISNCYWMYLLFPYISEQLVSLSGNFSAIPFNDFIQFSKAQKYLQHLTVCSNVWTWFLDHEEVDLLPTYPFPLRADVLPDLRSFSGPFGLAPEFIRNRPVTRLALGCHLPAQDCAIPLTSSYGLTVFPHTHSGVYTWDDLYINNHEAWDELEATGGRIRELFVRFDLLQESPSLIAKCFPNLVHLQVEPWTWSTYDFKHTSVNLDDYLIGLGDAMRDLQSLEILIFSDTDIRDRYRYRTLWLSPGDQHSLVHRLFKQNSPTLRMIVFSPWMVWHLRGPALGGSGECHCELELLSTKNIREELRRMVNCVDPFLVPVRDWNGKLAGAFKGEPFGSNETTQEILKAMLVDTSLCA